MINIQKIKNSSSILRIEAGTVIIREGDTDTSTMYIILQGGVNVYKHYGTPQQVKLAYLNAGNFFGEMSLFLNRERTADVVAGDNVTVLEVSVDNAYAFFETQPELTFSLMRTLCDRIDECNKRLAFDKPMCIGAPEVASLDGLFPPGHKKYDFTIDLPEGGIVYSKKYQCPLCTNHFAKDVPRHSNMHLAKTDPDLRKHYKGMAAVNFEIITCPFCYFSAAASQFEKVASYFNKDELSKILAPYWGKLDFSGTSITDINTMFAGYYLAARCAPVCFTDSDIIAARIWHHISWLYGDCGDSDMCKTAGKAALELYVKSYTNMDFPDEEMIRIQLIIAELSFQLGDLKTASDYFMKVKINKRAGTIHQRLAADRIYDLNFVRW